VKIAVLSDVHGNLRALEAVLAHLDGIKPDAIVNLGDCVSGPLWPGETCDRLRALPAITVRGNHDRIVGQDAPETMSRSDRFAYERTTGAQRAWLRELPFERELEGVWCFHANPRDDMGYLVDEVVDGKLRLPSAELVQARLGTAKRPVVLCGHSHQPRIVRLPGGVVIINAGSVGWGAYVDAGPPWHVCETGTPHTRYALVTIGSSKVQVESVALEYDWEDAAATALRHGRADWAHALRTGYVAPEVNQPGSPPQ